MFGLSSFGIWSAYLLCILSALICVVYGAVNWNKGDEDLKKEDLDWAKEEKTEVEDAL